MLCVCSFLAAASNYNFYVIFNESMRERGKEEVKNTTEQHKNRFFARDNKMKNSFASQWLNVRDGQVNLMDGQSKKSYYWVDEKMRWFNLIMA